MYDTSPYTEFWRCPLALNCNVRRSAVGSWYVPNASTCGVDAFTVTLRTSAMLRLDPVHVAPEPVLVDVPAAKCHDAIAFRSTLQVLNSDTRS